MKKTILITVFSCLIPIQSFAYTGNDLADMCKSKAMEDLCISFTKGVSDGVSAFNAMLNEAKVMRPMICLPEGLRTSQISDMTIKFMDENPKFRHYPAGMLILKVLLNEFPCKTP